MNFNDYQKKAFKTAQYPLKNEGNIIYTSMGLAGESGECLDKIKKYWRNSGFDYLHTEDLSNGQKEAICLELGDVLWYIAAFATELGISLDDVAYINLNKLKDRKERDVIKSEGDNR